MNSGPLPVQGWLYRSASDRLAGTVELRADTVCFQADKEALELPVDGLQCRPGGINDGTIFLSHPSHRGEIAIERNAMASHPGLARLPMAADALSAASRLVRRHRLFWGCVAVAVLIGLGLLTTLLMTLLRSFF